MNVEAHNLGYDYAMSNESMYCDYIGDWICAYVCVTMCIVSVHM